MNFVLCGMMACGKTTVGEALSKALGWELVDTDAVIADRYGAIKTLFERLGEAEFRRLEKAIVQEAAARDGIVIATGGGVLTQEDNRAALKQNGTIVYLRATLETLCERLEGDETRPLLQGDGWQKTLEALLKARKEQYAAAADIVTDVDGKTPQQIVEELMKTIGREGI